MLTLLGRVYDANSGTLAPVVSTSPAWKNHPAVLMWKGHEGVLLKYMEAVVAEWKRRGYSSAAVDKWMEALYNDMELIVTVMENVSTPPWLGRTLFHDSHRSNLIRKDPVFYSKFKWRVPADLPYVWPVQKANL